MVGPRVLIVERSGMWGAENYVPTVIFIVYPRITAKLYLFDSCGWFAYSLKAKISEKRPQDGFQCFVVLFCFLIYAAHFWSPAHGSLQREVLRTINIGYHSCCDYSNGNKTKQKQNITAVITTIELHGSRTTLTNSGERDFALLYLGINNSNEGAK